jgi:WD40 repeat protein
MAEGIAGRPATSGRRHVDRADGRRFLLWEHTALQLWADGPLGAELTCYHDGEVYGALAFPGGRFLSWSEDKTLRLWRSDGTPDGDPLRGHESGVTGAVVLLDGGFLSWSKDKTLRLWRSDGLPAAEPLRGHRNPIEGALLLPDGRILSREERMICTWTSEGRLQRAIPFDAPIMLCDGKTVVTARDGRLVVYDLHLDRANADDWDFGRRHEG